MDFQTLARRDLQALCKRNKIPANMTNVAMAEALKALQLVEGIDEIMQPSQSGTAQSSTESFDMADVTSPFVSQTAGRSTRRANIPKPVPESVNPTTRTRRTTRKTQVKDADAIETPAPMSQANRKKVQTASAVMNMDSQLMECEDTDTKDSLVTPAPKGTTSRRSKLDESAAKIVYSTRRSARLAVKSSKKELADKDGVDSFNELSGFTGESEVVSIGKEEPEVVSDQKEATIGEEIKSGSYAEEEAKLEKEKCNYEEEKPVNVSNEVQQKNGSEDGHISEIEIASEMKTEEGESSGVQQDIVDNALENRDNIAADDNTGFNDEIKEELISDIKMDGGSRDVTDLNEACVKLTELTLQQATKEADSEYVDSLDVLLQSNKNEANKVESLQTEEIEKAAADHEQSNESIADLSKQENEPIEMEYVELVPSDKQLGDFSEQIPKLAIEIESAELVPSDEQLADFSEQIPKSAVDVEGSVDPCVIVQEPHFSPSKDSASVTMKSAVFSEYIESGTKLIVLRDDDGKMAGKSEDDGLRDMSMRQLTKMLKEKLEITKKTSKNENDNMATARIALQPISENRMVEDAQN